jgi:hypothetical protein
MVLSRGKLMQITEIRRNPEKDRDVRASVSVSTGLSSLLMGLRLRFGVSARSSKG